MTDIELNAKEQREYRLGAALLALADEGERSGLAFEVSDSLGTPSRGGLLIPNSLQVRAGLDTATATKGAEIKFTQAHTFIEALRNQAVVIKGGATVLDGLVGDLSIPRQNGAATASWTTQNPLADVADTSITLQSVAMSPKELIGTTSYSRQLLAQSFASAAVDGIVRRDLAQVHAIAIDLAALNGSGASGQPTGVLNTAAIPTIAFGVNGLIPTWPLVTSFEKTVSIAEDGGDFSSRAYIVTPEVRDRMRLTDRTAGTTGWMILPDDQDINEYPVLVTNQLPKNLTKGTSVGTCHAIIFGSLSEILIGFWGALEIIPDPYRLKKQGMIELTTYQLTDIALRHLGSFAVSKDALP